MDWSIGKIDKLLCNKDGEVRSAEIIVIRNGRRLKFQRPIIKLYHFKCCTEKEKGKSNFVKTEGTKMIKVAGEFIE